MFRIWALLIGYGIGLVQTAYIVGKVYHLDIREHGSGNAGSTNVLRVLGKKAAMITFACDILKAVTACVLCRVIFGESGATASLYGGLGAVLGHNFPFYLGFRGGKGVASTIGVVMANGWLLIACTYPVGILALFTRYVSFASLMFALSIPISMFLLSYPAEHVCLGAVFTILCYYQHRANIKRLLQGTENRLGQKKK